MTGSHILLSCDFYTNLQSPPPPFGSICCYFIASYTIYFLGMLWPIHHLPDSGRSLHRKHIFRLFSFFTQLKPILSILTKPTKNTSRVLSLWIWLIFIMMNGSDKDKFQFLDHSWNHKFSNKWAEVWNEAAETSCWTWRTFYLEIGMKKTSKLLRRHC